MDTSMLLTAIDQEIGRLTQARDLLSGNGNSATKSVKRNLSPEARKRIADAQKRRWAATRIKAAK